MICIPVLLVALNGPSVVTAIGDAVTHPQHLSHVLRARFDAETTIALLWTLAWLVWGWFVICLALEASARLRGSSPTRMPGSRHVQAWAALVVSACLAMGTTGRHGTIMRLQVSDTTARGHARPVTDVFAPGLPWDDTTSREAQQPTDVVDVVSAPEGTRYTVRPGDTLWSIAEVELGNPLEWPRIAEANYGLPQPDGSKLTDDHWIRPGWVFVLPVTATTPPGQPEPPGVPEATAVPASANGAAPAVAKSPPPSAGTRAGTIAAIDHTGSSTQAAPRSGATVESATTPTSTGRDGHATRRPAVPVAPIGYGILGAAVIAVLDRMRRAQQRRRAAGLRITMPVDDIAALEQGLRVAADHGAVDWVDFGLRLLCTVVERNSVEPPSIRAVRVRDAAIDFLVDPALGPAEPVSPFEAGADGTSWVLVRDRERLAEYLDDAEVAGTAAPLPALVTLGRDGHGLLLLNLERAGSVAVSGSEADLLLQAMAIEMATAPWAEQADLVLVGFPERHGGLERVSHASSIRPVIAKMERRVHERRALLALSDQATNATSRWVDRTDGWDLCVVVCAAEALTEDVGAILELVELVEDGSMGVVVVCAGAVPQAALSRDRRRGPC